MKTILFNTEARTKLKGGIDVLADAVKVTLGPNGRNVIIQKNGMPHITKDGVTVAKFISLEDAVENMGAQIVMQVANKTAELAGDGTTTATVLAQSILSEGLKYISTGSNAIDIKRGIDRAVDLSIKELKKQSKPINSEEEMEQIATISANNDQYIGKVIAQAFRDVGKDGNIVMDDSRIGLTYTDVVTGLKFASGYLTPFFINNSVKNTSELNNAYVIVINGKLSSIKDIMGLLDKVATDKKPLLLIANEIEDGALQSLISNKMNGSINLTIVMAPVIDRENILDDVATLTGGKVIYTFRNLDSSYIGEASSITVDKETTLIKGGKGDVTERVELIKAQLKEAEDKLSLKNRLARLTGGIAVIYIGASTDLELNEKRDRFDDAIKATRAALEEGILPGGGVAYLRVLGALNRLKTTNKDENIGIKIVTNALEYPIKQILLNAGIEPTDIISRIKRGKNDYGYNVRTEKFEYLIKTGIIDPAKVTRIALENAASISGMLLTTECVVVDSK